MKTARAENIRHPGVFTVPPELNQRLFTLSREFGVTRDWLLCVAISQFANAQEHHIDILRQEHHDPEIQEHLPLEILPSQKRTSSSDTLLQASAHQPSQE